MSAIGSMPPDQPSSAVCGNSSTNDPAVASEGPVSTTPNHKRKTTSNAEASESDDDCIMANAIGVSGNFSTTGTKDAMFETTKRFKASSRRYSNINKNLNKRLAAVNEQNVQLETFLARSRASHELAKTMTNNAVTTAVGKAKAEGALTVATEVTKAKIAAQKAHQYDMTGVRNAYEVRIAGFRDINRKTLHDVKEAANEIRFTQLFDSSLTRGEHFCPVSQLPIMAIEGVVALVANCNCNCIVKLSHGSKYIHDFDVGNEVCCLTCREVVHSVVVTTARQSESMYAWRVMERLTSCSSEQKLIDDRLAQIEKAAEDKTVQDTHTLRTWVENLVKTAPKV
ncbi:hypothetical protein T484DRAFT_1756610 [Baffinella frigidus]|nr:hypothetical protein T484DRAFT_1756610 [Cryptophyta sp. CCMP2293]